MRRLALFLAAVLVGGCYQAAGSIPPSDGATEAPSVALPTLASESSPVSPSVAAPASRSPEPSATPVEPEPTTDVPACPSGNAVTGGGFAKLTAVTVVVDALNLRAGPCLKAPLVRTEVLGNVDVLANPLKKGTLLVVVAGPIASDGYRWYAIGTEGPGNGPTAGWVAAGTTSDSWIRAATLSCPESNLVGIAGLTAIERLACFGSESLAFTAHQAAIPFDAGFGGGCEQFDPRQPAWLWCWNINYNVVNTDGGPVEYGRPQLNLFFDPATGIKPSGLAPVGTIGPAYDIRGHLDDPAAARCTSGFAARSVAWYEAFITCAVEFVVEDLKPAS